MYTLLIQNKASKKEYVIRGLQDKSKSYLCYTFEHFYMPDGSQYGEYEALLFTDDREDSEYNLSDVLENTVVSTADGDVMVKHLRPERFMLKYGDISDDKVYRETNKTYYYKG